MRAELDIANFIVNVFSAIGTVGAVILSLILASKKEKPKIIVDKNDFRIETENETESFFSIAMMNNDLQRAYSIKEIGYKNSLLKKWVNLSFSKEQCQKKDDSKMENGQYKCIDCNLSDKFKCGQELYIVLNKKQVEDLITSNNKKSVKIAIIFLGEYKLWLKVSKKYLKQYVE